MTRDDVQRWLDGYVEAWRTYLDMTPLISETVDLAGAAAKLDGTPRREAGKVLVVPGPS